MLGNERKDKKKENERERGKGERLRSARAKTPGSTFIYLDPWMPTDGCLRPASNLQIIAEL